MPNASSPDPSHEGSGVFITYYTDPLCVWSWGFEPVWRRLRYEYEGRVRWRYRMGGMIPSWREYQDPLNEVDRPLHLGPLSRQVTEISGMPIDDRVWVEHPPSSSYPACLAVKAAERQSSDAGERYLRRVREALMLHGRNVAERDVLLGVAEEVEAEQMATFSVERFERDLGSDDALEALRGDLRAAREAGVGRFPTLTLESAGTTPRIIVGYRPYEVLLLAVASVAPGIAPSRSVADAASYETYWGTLTGREREDVTSQASKGVSP